MPPLADQMRPSTLADIAGQDHLIGPTGAIGRMIEHQQIQSMILWGPPGCGKTTLARVLAQTINAHTVQLSAVRSGMADLRRVFDEAQARKPTPTVVFLDEIHRYNRGQQDALLPVLEDGTIILIGATTENPSFALTQALLSRARVYVLRGLDNRALLGIVARAERLAGRLPLAEAARDVLVSYAGGDGRFLLGLIEDLRLYHGPDLDPAALAQRFDRRPVGSDKNGDIHYDLLSVFHKSCRASDPQAALYWAARLIEGGEDPRVVLRRLQCVASEDVGLADPQAMVQVLTAWQAFERLGWPEGRIPLAQAICYVATCPKSNAAYQAFDAALTLARQTHTEAPPLAGKNAPTPLLQSLGAGGGYQYDHATPEGFSGQNFLPPSLDNPVFYAPVERGFEREIRKRLEYWTRIRQEKYPSAP